MGNPHGGEEGKTETDTRPKRRSERHVLGLEGLRAEKTQRGRLIPLPSKKPRVHRPALGSSIEGLEEEKPHGARSPSRWIRLREGRGQVHVRGIRNQASQEPDGSGGKGDVLVVSCRRALLCPRFHRVRSIGGNQNDEQAENRAGFEAEGQGSALSPLLFREPDGELHRGPETRMHGLRQEERNQGSGGIYRQSHDGNQRQPARIPAHDTGFLEGRLRKRHHLEEQPLLERHIRLRKIRARIGQERSEATIGHGSKPRDSGRHPSEICVLRLQPVLLRGALRKGEAWPKRERDQWKDLGRTPSLRIQEGRRPFRNRRKGRPYSPGGILSLWGTELLHQGHTGKVPFGRQAEKRRKRDNPLQP